MSTKTPRKTQAQIEAHSELWALFKQQHEFKRANYPEWATYDGDHRFDDRLTDLSDEAVRERNDKNHHFLKQLNKITYAELNPDDQINYDLFADMLQEEINFHELGFHYLNVDQQEGLHISFPQIIEIQPLHTYEQYERYFSRLRGFSKQVQDTITNLKVGIQKGVVLPQRIVAESLKQIEDIKNLPIQDMPFILPFTQNSKQLSEQARQKVAQVIEQILKKHVQPAYQTLYDFLKQDYMPHCHDKSGLWALPQGEAMYQFMVEKYTQPGMTPDEIHQLGLHEVERIYQEIKTLKSDIGFKGDMKAFHQFLREDPQFYYTDPQKMIHDYKALLEKAMETLPTLFGKLPKADCILKEIEAYRAASAPQAYYYPPPMDGSRPGVYYVNTFELPARPKFTMTALTLHEALPGHHLQLALGQEIESLPDFRYHLDATAYIEGWALYAESLGKELGLYQDPYQLYGALDFEIWRATRLVVDTALHYKRWSRDQALEYMRKYTANSELDIISEVDRYIALPGQALSYKIGEMKIWDLRRLAEKKLGAQFSLADFHDQVLCNGSVPLAVLEKHMAHWLHQKMGPVHIPPPS